jgi:hypothetical protein
MRIVLWLLCAALLLSTPGCEDLGEPIDLGPQPIPVWTDDIAPLITAECGRCHTLPPTNGALATFRLDKYERSDTPDNLPGAYEMRVRLRVRAVLQRTMPPDKQLTRDQRDRIDRWVLGGGLKE